MTSQSALAAPKTKPSVKPAIITPKSNPAVVSSNIPDGTLPFPAGTRILFQGDSITDGGRGRSEDPNHIYGQDYAYLIAANCGGHYPEKGYVFLNRGVSGNKVTDLASRWQTDTLDLKPHVLSILIGVNDIASVVNSNGTGGVTAQQYEQVYDQLLQSARAANPNIKFVLGEPFTLPIGHTLQAPDLWTSEIKLRQAAVERLAAKYHAPVVHYQDVFNEAIKRAPISFWIWDGIHPTYAGHQLMADEWQRTVKKFYPVETVRALTKAAPSSIPGGTMISDGAIRYDKAVPSDNTKSITLGWSFTTGASKIIVTSLGYLNDGETGSGANHVVGIFDAGTKTLLTPVTTIATSGGDLTGNNPMFSYVRLATPLTLEANTQYVISATESGTGWLQAPKNVVVGYGIDLASLHCAYHFGDGLTFPDLTYAANDPAFLGPNFLGAIVP